MYELINDVPLKIKEYNGQRVVTFRDIDTIHNRPEGTARKRFNDNRKHFIEGEDYFKVCVSEIRTNKIMDISPKTQRDVILITESGYLMLVKSFTDELAWSVQRQLVKTYFRVQEIKNSYDENLSIKLDLLERKINALDKKVETAVNRVFDQRVDGIIKAIKKDISVTSYETINTLIPCFDYMHKVLKKLRKELKKL